MRNQSFIVSEHFKGNDKAVVVMLTISGKVAQPSE